MIKIYTAVDLGTAWLARYQGRPCLFACVLGFTATGLIPGISAAGATPSDRQYTAVADAEFLSLGPTPQPRYALPPLQQGASPAFISRAVITELGIPLYLFDAGLAIPPSVPAIALGGLPARCLSSGQALPLATVKHLFQQGLMWGEKLAQQVPGGYVILGECVVGGTTTALAVLTGLGIDAQGKVNSSHRDCNHQQKWSLVQQGLASADYPTNPWQVVSAVGDPMQITVAGMAIAASQRCGVLLAGGTQMLAVYGLMRALEPAANLEEIVIGTTRWVAEDNSGDTIGLAQTLAPAPLLATELNFSHSHYPSFRAYEQGYVKEGVGAGGCAIAAHLTGGWTQTQLLHAIETLATQAEQLRINSH